jgi:glutamyl-tRNA(Gln) amidotransferase subunit E
MVMSDDPDGNTSRSRKLTGYVPRSAATRETYEKIGFKSGLEIHQQLLTEKKLFCNCPAGLYQEPGDYDAEVVRHMRPTLSELGEYDGTALMEFKTRKNIYYRIRYDNACTYDIDDTPPFPINREALEISLLIALILKMNIVGELHITRKQYLDGSIPTGFQRTGIVGIEGEIPITGKTIRISHLTVEEDACREVSDIGHERVFRTDRLGMPLIETVTYPDMTTPDEVAEAAHYLQFAARSSGKVRTGIGAAREDVNVSVTGGTRVEIKGVAHIRQIPELTHNEAFRQVALLLIRDELRERISDLNDWHIGSAEIDPLYVTIPDAPVSGVGTHKRRIMAVNLPQFAGILSFFTQPGKIFADEISDRLKVIACLEKPNCAHSEQTASPITEKDWAYVRDHLRSGKDDAQVLLWGPEEDIPTALETVEERCKLAFSEVPNETRKALPDGTTIFERVLPGPDRMYPDTDSAPLPITEEMIARIRKLVPPEVRERVRQLEVWKVPYDTFAYLLRRNLVPVMERIVDECKADPKWLGAFFGQTFKAIEGRRRQAEGFTISKVYGLLRYLHHQNIDRELTGPMIEVLFAHPFMEFTSVLQTVQFVRRSKEEIMALLPALRRKFRDIRISKEKRAEIDWLMGKLRPFALGNLPLGQLYSAVKEEIGDDGPVQRIQGSSTRDSGRA